MFNSAVFIILIQLIAILVAQSQLIYDRIDLAENSCFTMQNGIFVNGSCLTIHNCPSVLSNVLNRIYDHTVCGYDGTTQIVCCPTEVKQLQKMKINLYQSLDCQIPNSNEVGVIKFVSECPELNQYGSVGDHFNKLCDFEVCADLVCCPVQHKYRLKKVCSKVDDPTDTLQLRLLQNQECTIKELNMKGIYQTTCDFAERNPHLKSLLQNVCNDVTCTGWYCCPIENIDKIACTKSQISSAIATFVGPKCVDSRSGRKGTCKIFWDCPESSNGDTSKLDKCGSHCCSDYYCCPDFDLVNLSTSAQACLSYTNYLQKHVIEIQMDSDNNKTVCTPRGAGAAGGILTKPGDFPHMAALGYESDGQEILWNCGGSLISDRYILTAAHCISVRAGIVKKVRLGVVDLLNDVNTPDCPEEYDVVRQITHPDYISRLVYNDIGLVELAGQVKFNFHIRPVCLPTSPDIPTHYSSMGWGAIGPMTDEKSVKLLLVYQTLFSHEECDELYRLYTNRKLNQGVLNETQICAGSRDSIQSTCTGDSGGPLLGQQSKYFGLFDIYGVVSFGTVCGFPNTPGIYTKVYPYVKWIEGVVWNN